MIKLAIRGKNSLAFYFFVHCIRLKCQMATGKYTNILIIVLLFELLMRFKKII